MFYDPSVYMTTTRAIRTDRWLVPLSAAIVVAVPFVSFTAFYLSHFYTTGSFLLDAGWTSYLIAHGGLELRYPLVLGQESYFHYHVSPILIGIALFRSILPVSDLQFVAGCLGFFHALPGVAVFWILRTGFGLTGLWTIPITIVAIAFAFNGEALAIARYPHPEIMVVAGIVLFLAAFARRRMVLATIFFLVALAGREDAGFHLFGILFIVIVLNRWHRVSWGAQAAEICFAAAAFVYSATAIALERGLAPGPSTMTLTYLGNPPFQKITLSLFLDRLLFCVAYRPYLVLPALVAGFWAARTRNPYIVAGYLAFIPWTLLQLVAHSDVAGTFSGYYAYPYMIAAFFPLVGVLLAQRQAGIGVEAATTAFAFAVMVAVSFVGMSLQYNPGRMNLATSLLSPPSLEQQALTDGALRQLTDTTQALGLVVADTSVATLAPDAFTPAGALPHDELERMAPTLRPDTVLYFAGGIDADRARRFASAAGLALHYRIRGTQLRLLTGRPVPLPLAALLERMPD